MKHSKITAIVLTLCMLVTLMVVAPTAASATTTDGNYIKDSSFETWGTTGERGYWFYENASNKSIVQPTDTEASDGKCSMMFKSTEETTGAQRVFQTLGPFTAGTKLKISFKINIKRLEGSYCRLIVRFDGAAGGESTDGSFANKRLEAKTDGWVEVSTTGTICSTDAARVMYPEFECYSTDFEIYVDDFKVELNVTKPALRNGDFESGALSPWTTTSSGGTPTVETDETTGNHYLRLDTQRRELAQQTINNLTVGKQYYVAFDMQTNGAHGHLNIYKTSTSTGIPVDVYDTNGKWERIGVEWTAGDTSARLQFRLETPEKDADNNTHVVTDEYVWIDNVVFGECDDNLLQNPSFEYGINGMGPYKKAAAGSNSFSSTGLWKTKWATNSEYKQVKGGMDGARALEIKRPQESEVEGNFGYFDILRESQPVVKGEKYIFTAYVKPGADYAPLAKSGSAQFYIAASNAIVNTDESLGTKGDYPSVRLEPGYGWTPITLVFTAESTTTTLTFRSYGGGTILFDNFSLRKIDTDPIITYTAANGTVSDGLVDGGNLTITMPITASAEADGETPAVVGDAGNIVALALYNKSGDYKTLQNVKVKTITKADETAGYASFALKADALGAKFADVNYAKLIVLKDGSYQALREYDLLVKAAQ